MRLPRSISLQTALTYMALFGFSVVVLIGALFWQSDALIRNELDDRVVREVGRLVALHENRGRDELVREVTAISKDPGSAIYWLADRGGGKLGGNLDRVAALQASRSLAGDWVEFDYQRETVPQTIRGRAVFLASDLYLFVGRDMSLRDQLYRSFGQSVIVAIVLIVGLGAVGGWLLARNIDRRLEEVNHTLGEIMAGDLSHRIDLGHHDDALEHLAGNINTMLERIEELVHAMRDVSENVAHDMRTPLNRIRNRIEIMTRRQASDVTDLSELLDEIDRLMLSFTAILSLARLESGSTHLERQPTDLRLLLSNLVDLYGPACEDAGMELRLECPDEACVAFVSEPLLQHAISNLIDNALKYGAVMNGELVLSLSFDDDFFVVSVKDKGVGIEAQDYDRVMRRFGRLDQARASDGHGLGLPFVRAVMRRHGGDVYLSKTEPAGLTVKCFLPRDHSDD